MKKLLSLVVLGAMLIAACGSGSGSGEVAATVDGQDVTVGDVEALIETDGATVPVDQFAELLAAQIQWLIFFDAAEADYGVTVSDEEVEEEATQLVEELAGEETREDFLAARGVTEEFLTNIAAQSLIDSQVRENFVDDAGEPTAEEIETARADAELAQTSACVSHILVATEDEANDVLSRLDSGEDFAEVAIEVSTDPGSGQNGGDLGCNSPGGYVEPFRDAVLEGPVGEVNPDAVESEFGFHIILVTELTEPAAEELPSDEDLATAVMENSVLADVEAWFYDAMEAADVTVGEEYGTWSPVPPTVTPPSSGTTGTTSGG